MSRPTTRPSPDSRSRHELAGGFPSRLARKEPPASSLGPLETEREACESTAAQFASAQTSVAVDARPQITRTAGAAAAQRAVQAPNLAMLTDACAAVGVELGAYDRCILAWLAGYEPSMCAVVAGVIRRAAGRAS